MATNSPTQQAVQTTPEHRPDAELNLGLMEFCAVHDLDSVRVIEALYHLDGTVSDWDVSAVSAGYRTDRVLLRIDHRFFGGGECVLLEESILPGDEQRFTTYRDQATEPHALITDATLDEALSGAVAEANRLFELRRPSSLVEHGTMLLKSLL